MKRYINEGLIVIVTILWGIISIFSKPLMQMGFSAMQLVFMRSIFSVVFLGVFILIADKSLFKIKLKDLPIFIGAGTLGFTFCVFCYMWSISENGAGVAAMLMYSSPVWTVIFSRFLFGEKINFFKIIALIGVVCGCVLVSLGGELKISFIGAILGIGSGVGLALINVFSKASANRNYSALTAQFYAFVVSSVASFPLSKAWEMPNMIATDINSLWYFLLLALICTVLPYVLYNLSMKKVTASTAGILASLEVVVGALTGFIVFNENIGALGVVGIAVMLCAMVFLGLSDRDKHIDNLAIDKEKSHQT